MSILVFLAAAAILSLERLCYVWIWRAPASFQRLCLRAPLAAIRNPFNALRFLFFGFKLLQAGVFAGWCSYHGGGAVLALDGGPWPLTAGALLIAAGQVLNIGVFYRLGSTGVFYGNKFGHAVPRSREFPFSLMNHPQYAGALLTIWGFFLIARFPHDDWFVLPLLETVYYSAGALLEH